MTILLSSHYMKDVAALCRRVVIIAQGRIIYDGSLSGIRDRFGGQKIITFQLANGEAPDLSRYGELLPSEAPRAGAGRPRRRARGPCPHPRRLRR